MPAPTRSGSRSQPAAIAYQVRVEGWSGTRQATLRGLCGLFKVDATTAERWMASVPGVWKRNLPAADAQRFADALAKLGARVALEPSQSASAGPNAKAGPPRPPAPPPIPAAMKRAPRTQGADRGGSDLEFDVLSALDAVLDEASAAPAPERSLAEELGLWVPDESSPRRSASDEFDLGGLSPQAPPERERRQRSARGELDAGPAGRPQTPARAARSDAEQPPVGRAPEREGLRRRAREEFEFSGAAGRGAPGLEIDQTALKPANDESGAHRKARTLADDPAPLPPGSKFGAGAPEHSRAALRMQQAVPPPTRGRSLHLLQVLAALGVAAGGHWLDSSVFFGTAGPLSVVLHGLALQQLVLGLKGMVLR